MLCWRCHFYHVAVNFNDLCIVEVMEFGIHVGYLYMPWAHGTIMRYATWAWLSMLDTVICQIWLCLILDRFELEDPCEL